MIGELLTFLFIACGCLLSTDGGNTLCIGFPGRSAGKVCVFCVSCLIDFEGDATFPSSVSEDL